ncbi:MAG: fibronectin type III domain-containing protein [Gammaproteobacteria bacterium]|nr:fibronectin type III domain-containing protein [Gammaproteobacteria bacterium]
MTDAKRGRASRRGGCLCTIAALGFALSGCGGGGGPAATAATSQAATTGLASADAPAAGSGAITLDWTPPTENTDGTPLTDLSGYDIHYGRHSGDYTQSISVSNPGIATYVVDNLTPGMYYFSVAAVNSDGTESPMSSEVKLKVN